MVSIVYKGKSKRTFARVVKEGKLNVYLMSAASSTPTAVHGVPGSPGGGQFRTASTTTFNEYVLLKRENWGPDAKAEPLKFRREMIEFFSDCPEVVKQIEDQALTHAELSIIVNFYYQYCGDE